MQHHYRNPNFALPPFHHYDLPIDVTNHPQYNSDNLMLGQNFLLLQVDEIHCRITYSPAHRNFKIIRPDNITQQKWNEIKQSGKVVVENYVQWYTTPPPPHATKLQNFFLHNSENSSHKANSSRRNESESSDEESEEETKKEVIIVQSDSDGEENSGIVLLENSGTVLLENSSLLEDGEISDRASELSKKATNVLEKFTDIDTYFTQYPHMTRHPHVYAIICGNVRPVMEDVRLLVMFANVWQENAIVVKHLFEAILSGGALDAQQTCRELINAGIYPHLIEKEGHLTYDINYQSLLNMENQEIVIDLKHDENMDRIILRTFVRESARQNVPAPLVEHIQQQLPQQVYRLYDMQRRITQLRRTRLWKSYYFSRNTCLRPDHRQMYESKNVQFLALCDGCSIESARERFNANWSRVVVQHANATSRKRVDADHQASQSKKPKFEANFQTSRY